MKTSVLMSVYKKDNPEYLKLALESIYENQTKKPDEIVVVFDGELTESLYAVLEEFRSNKEDVVHYYPQEENRGLGEALKIGAGYCTGDYIFRMDSDDISHPLRFEKQLAYIEDHPEVDVLGSCISEFEQSPDEQMRCRVCPQYQHDILRMAKKRNPMNHMTVCIKKEALEKCGGYQPLLLLEDYYLWIRMLANGAMMANLQESLVYVRCGKGFYERRGSTVRIRGWKTLQKYMLEHNMINRFDAMLNMASIVGFTYCPGSVRKFAYNKLLRNHQNNNVQSENTGTQQQM